MNLHSVISQESRKRGQAAGAAARRRIFEETGRPARNGEMTWHIPTIERVSVAEFERLLVAKFGPLYLEPVDFRWIDGKLTPVGEWWKQGVKVTP